MKAALICLFILCSVFHNAQRYSSAEIDSLLEWKHYELRISGRHKEAINLNKQLLMESKKMKYTKGEVWAYINLGNLYCTLGENEKSIYCLQLAESIEIDDDFLKSLIYTEYGRNYNILRLIDKSNENYDQSIRLAKRIKDNNKRRRLLGYSYASKADNFEGTKMQDSLFFYLKKAYENGKGPITAARISGCFSFRNSIDSAEFYLKEANKLFNSGVTPSLYNKSILLLNQGILLSAKKDYRRALESYEKSLTIMEKLKKQDGRKSLYKLISDTHKLLNNREKSNEYLEKYSSLKDSLDIVERKLIEVSVDKFINKKEKENNENKNKLYIIITSILLLFVFSFFLGCWKFKKNNLQKETLLQQKEDIINQKEEETVELKQRMDTVFGEIASLAKQNDPLFLYRFQEVYPDFCNKLLEINPKLVNSELHLCAMTRLNFSSKDIAKYTFVQYKTVEMRKYRLRKKLGISADENFYMFMKNL
ncbi:tetratricopeptide repeat protein [Chryseobacterium lathyri]|nr:hypothetical protein [Chryseobacterium lathyri]